MGSAQPRDAAPTQGCVLLLWAHRALRCRAPGAASVISIIRCTHAGRRGAEQRLIPLSQRTLNPCQQQKSPGPGAPQCTELCLVLRAPSTPRPGSSRGEVHNMQQSLFCKLDVMNAQKQQNDEAPPGGGAALPLCPLSPEFLSLMQERS